jgi:hypothetical protein
MPQVWIFETWESNDPKSTVVILRSFSKLSS